MFKFRHIALALIAFTVATAPTARGQSKDPLEPLKFLEGTWHGEGKSPFGPYEFEAKNERRGRWLVGTSNIYVPGTDRLSFVGTGIIGYDDKGLVLYAFESAGVTIFRGELADGGVRFEWRNGDSYRLRTLRPLPDGKIANREETYLPAQSKEKLIFESVSLPGRRERK